MAAEPNRLINDATGDGEVVVGADRRSLSPCGRGLG
jgi:hypothetical protein